MLLMADKEKKFVFPRVVNNSLEFAEAKTHEEFVNGTYGIPEPVEVDCINIKDINLIIVPGIVFDCKGNRLGYGKGFYDRLLSEYTEIDTMGVCYSDFLLESLEADPWDARVKYVVTQNGILKTKKEVAQCH